MPQESEQDIIIVRNVDIDCDFVDESDGSDHHQGFSVKWGGHPHTIRAGATRLMPRFVADHYAKHLTDHILLKEEAVTKKTGILNDARRRKSVIESILIGVEQFHYADTALTPGEATARLIDDLNEEEVKSALNLGKVPNKAIGYSKGADDVTLVVPSKEEMKETEIPSPVKASEAMESTDVPTVPIPRTHNQLVEECVKLEIELDGKETTKQLQALLAAY
jgi:hypothetical protein